MPGLVPRLPLVLAALASLAIPATSSAAEFSLGGYFRMRMLLFDSLAAGVNDQAVPNGATTQYWQYRGRLDPKIKLNDNVSFYAQVDLLDNVVAGDNPEIDSAFGTQLTEFFSPSVLPQHDASVNNAGDVAVIGNSTQNIAVKRAWGEVMTGVGQLKFGRMGSHWGLGILANDGNDWDSDYGDTVDRIMFITKAGPIYVVPMIDMISAGPFQSSGANGLKAFDPRGNPVGLSQPSSIVDEAVLAVVYRGELSSGGAYGVFRQQPSTSAQAFIGDVWGKTRIGSAQVEGEAVYLKARIDNFVPPNTPPTLTATQWGFAVESSLPLGHLTPGLNFGAASGGSSSEPANGSLNDFQFAPDYHIALLLFRYVNPGGTPNSLPGVTNAYYARPQVKYELFDNFTLDGALVYAQTVASSVTYNSGPYGYELDLGATWRLYENFELGFRYGGLVPGSALKPVTATTKLDGYVQGGEGRFLIRF